MSYHDHYIDRGVAVLDEKVPGWEQKIDLRELDLNNCRTCVVGQLFGAYSTGLRALDLSDSRPDQFGFALSWDEHRITYGGLTTAWKRRIRQRRRAHAAATSTEQQEDG